MLIPLLVRANVMRLVHRNYSSFTHKLYNAV
jgi:hypothetical protein